MLRAYAQSGLGSTVGFIVRPMIGPLLAGREREIKLIEADTTAETELTLAVGRAGTRLIDAVSNRWQEKIESGEWTPSPEEVIDHYARLQVARRLDNSQSIVSAAAEELGDEEVPNQEPDHDFTARFFNHGQEVSDEELQKLWGKLLAGAIVRPGSVDPLTLDVMRNLNRSIAGTFQRFCSIAVSTNNDTRVLELNEPAGQNGLSKYGFSYQTLRELQEHGLVGHDLASWLRFRVIPDDHPLASRIEERDRMMQFEFQSQRYIFGSVSGDHLPDTSLQLNGVALTGVGRQIAAIVDDDAVAEYADDLREHLAAKDLQMIPLG